MPVPETALRCPANKDLFRMVVDQPFNNHHTNELAGFSEHMALQLVEKRRAHFATPEEVLPPAKEPEARVKQVQVRVLTSFNRYSAGTTPGNADICVLTDAEYQAAYQKGWVEKLKDIDPNERAAHQKKVEAQRAAEHVEANERMRRAAGLDTAKGIEEPPASKAPKAPPASK